MRLYARKCTGEVRRDRLQRKYSHTLTPAIPAPHPGIAPPARQWSDEHSIMFLTAGTRLGIYEVTAKIGDGGMDEVYQARDTKLDRDVALKALPEGGVE